MIRPSVFTIARPRTLVFDSPVMKPENGARGVCWCARGVQGGGASGVESAVFF